MDLWFSTSPAQFASEYFFRLIYLLPMHNYISKVRFNYRMIFLTTIECIRRGFDINWLTTLTAMRYMLLWHHHVHQWSHHFWYIISFILCNIPCAPPPKALPMSLCIEGDSDGFTIPPTKFLQNIFEVVFLMHGNGASYPIFLNKGLDSSTTSIILWILLQNLGSGVSLVEVAILSPRWLQWETLKIFLNFSIE